MAKILNRPIGSPERDIFGEECTRAAFLEEKRRLHEERKRERDCHFRRTRPGYEAIKNTKLGGLD